MIDGLWALALSGQLGSAEGALAPTADIGWPVNRVGVNGGLWWSPEAGIVTFRVGLQGSVYGMANDLGLPGPRVGTAASLPLGLRVGPVGFGYEPIAYVDTRGTSQPSAAASLFVVTDRVDAIYRFENDFLARPLGDDEFRTGAAELHVRFRGSRITWGVGGEMRFWTASTRGLEADAYDEVYDLTGAPGEGFSHGIVCLAVTVGPVRTCAGWDAEGIRDAVQNRFVHRAIDVARVPTLDRAPQPYLRVTLNPSGLSY